MIDYFFGRPRSGKSYRAVKYIYDNYLKNENSNPKYSYILTNIAGFKFKEINQIFRDRGSKSFAYKLIWDDFYKHLTALHKMALDEKSDEELNRYAYSHKINDVLIVFDEASLRFKKYDDVISWFLAYHGHFKIQIIIIAQGPKQINSDYLEHTEIYYEAQKQSKQFRDNQLRYIHYDEIPFNPNNKFGSDTITTKQEIYDLYKSGETDKPKKVLYKFLLIMIFAIVVMISLFKLFAYKYAPPEDESNQKQETETNALIEEQSDYITQAQNEDYIILDIRCDEKNCWNIDRKFENTSISLQYFKYIVINYKLKLLFEEIKNEIYTLTPYENTLSKRTFAKLTDYHYLIPKILKDGELHVLYRVFEPEPEMKENSLFNTENLAENVTTNALVRSE
jgi:hypothetical protein